MCELLILILDLIEIELKFRSTNCPNIADYDIRSTCKMINDSLFHMIRQTQNFWTYTIKKAPVDTLRISLKSRKILSELKKHLKPFYIMRINLIVIPVISIILIGCANNHVAKAIKPTESFEPVAKANELNKESSSIKDFVYNLPAYSYHEAGVDYAHRLISEQSIVVKEFRGKNLEAIDYIGDGTIGRSTFYLDRNSGVLWAYYYAWEPGSTDTITQYRLVPEGWMVKTKPLKRKRDTTLDS